MHATESESLEFFRSMYGGPADNYLPFASELAKAEAWKDAEIAAGRLRVRWVNDDDNDLSWAEDDAEYMRKVQDGLIEFMGCIVERKCCECGAWKHAASLWSIDFDTSTDQSRQYSRKYQRLVEAELAMEAMPS
jgi:two-component SAPR family response regulator